MSWRLKVVHTTGLRYESEVLVSFNEARMTPADGLGQLLITHDLTITPRTRVSTYVDYWGTVVEAFDIHEPHTGLEVVSSNVVDTPSPAEPPGGLDWDTMASDQVRDMYCEYLRPSSYVDVPGDDDPRSDVVAAMRAAQTPHDGVTVALEHIGSHFQYISGSTSVLTTAREAWESGSGVCQDYSHISLSLLRAAGIPARYVSGYLYPGDGNIGETVTGESHAWIEIWNGAWWPCDPTNSLEVAERHTVVARGRDYSDVSPLKGVYSGGRSEELGVSVSLTRLPR